MQHTATIESHGVQFHTVVTVGKPNSTATPVRVEITNDDMDSYETVYDSMILADSYWELIGTALTNGLDIEWEQADWYLAEWGIFCPSEDDE